MPPRRHCPSCQARLQPLALECPVCGLPLPRQASLRPLLFQASALTGKAPVLTPRIAIATPALGRIAPVPYEPTEPDASAAPAVFTVEEPASSGPLPSASAPSSFLILAKVEGLEALLLAAVNGALLLVVWLSAQSPISRVYGELWHLLLVLHLAVSWTLFLVPITLTGQSLLMGRHDLLVDADQPERRIAFSLFHMVAVVLFPVSFLCMVVTAGHRTLAELLTGQEILMRSSSRNR